MPRRALSLCALALALGCGPHAPASVPAATAPAARPPSKLQFDEVGKELGVVAWPKGKDVSFTFNNAGPRKIAILDLYANCGCSNPRLAIVKRGEVVREGFQRGETAGPLLVVEPGEAGELKVRFESVSLAGDVKDHVSMITISTDERDVDPIRLFVRAQIERKWELAPKHVVFDPMGAKQIQTKNTSLFILSPGAVAPFEARVVSAPPGVAAGVRDALKGLRPYVDIEILAGPGLKQQLIQGEVVVEGKFAKPQSEEWVRVQIPITVPVVADVAVKPSLFDFQMVEAGKPARSVPVNLNLLDPDRKYQLGNAKIEGDSADLLKLEVKPVRDGQSYELTLLCEAGLPACGTKGIHGMVAIPTGLADFPELRLEYRAFTRTVPSAR